MLATTHKTTCHINDTVHRMACSRTKLILEFLFFGLDFGVFPLRLGSECLLLEQLVLNIPQLSLHTASQTGIMT